MRDTEVECPQCGAIVYYELERCPECGLSFYESDDEVEEDPEPLREKGWNISLVAIGLGWLAASTAAFTLFYLNRLIDPGATDWGVLSLLFAAGSAFIGGYVAGAIAKRRPVLYGSSVALLAIINAVLLETLWREVTVATLIRPMTLLSWTLIVAGGIAGAVAFTRLWQRTISLQQPTSSEADLYLNLLARVRHDQGVADRLIAFERRRNPTASRIALIRNAIAQWEHDNR